MAKKRKTTVHAHPYWWKRAFEIFGNPRPPSAITQQQFDGCQEVLEDLVAPFEDQFPFEKLQFYYDDLAYVELQNDLFMYVFPICLVHWHESLKCNQEGGELSEFHSAVRRGDIFEKMLSAQQREDTWLFFRDSFLDRLDAERGFIYERSKTTAYGWMRRFNSLAKVMPRIDLIWEAWWKLETAGRAVAALQYCSALMYRAGENPLFGAGTSGRGGPEPDLTECDSCILDEGWLEENLVFLLDALTAQFVKDRVEAAAVVLKGEPESEKAQRLLEDYPKCSELVESRVNELPDFLGKADHRDGWTV